MTRIFIYNKRMYSETTAQPIIHIFWFLLGDNCGIAQKAKLLDFAVMFL